MSDVQKTCFIIMPITTPKAFVNIYRDGEDHFRHVLDCLHLPAVKKARFNPILPIAKGADLIHAEIIRKLESSDLVLCDISTLNPNVFFELGVRTSLNKPVCLVKDEHTGKPPFDIGPVNHKDYQSALDPWNLEKEVSEIAGHVKDSYQGSSDENTLWRKFGMKAEAEAYKRRSGEDGKFDEIIFMLDNIQAQIDYMDGKSGLDKIDRDTAVVKTICEIVLREGPEPIHIIFGMSKIKVVFKEEIPSEAISEIGKRLIIVFGGKVFIFAGPNREVTKFES